MQEMRYDSDRGVFRYRICGQEICITAYEGTVVRVEIPAQIAGMPIAQIGKKAFLSRKHIREVTLPATVREVEDWAFAHCDGLQTVTLRSEKVRFGKSVFLGCGELKSIEIAGKSPEAARLLAVAVTVADAPYLLNPEETGSGDWLAKWDARMLAILHSADTEGYSRQVLCGEEDYGSTDLNAYTSGRRRSKVRLIMLRLLNSAGLREDVREELLHYLRTHTKDCGSEETWKVVLEEHGEEQAYFELLTASGCVTEENLVGMLEDMGEEHPQMKAYLLRYREENLQPADFFAGLEL